MSKNLTRKGLAFGAMVALGATSLVAVPAIADTTGPVTLTPTAGTTFNSILQSGITLKSNLDANEVTANQAGSLAYVITNPGAKDITVTFDTAGSLDEVLFDTSNTAYSTTNPVTPLLNDAARLNGSVAPVSKVQTTDSKNIYITGSTTSNNGSFSNTLLGEVQTVTGLSTLPIGHSARLTLPNGEILSTTNTTTTALSLSQVVARLVASSEYDTRYATIELIDGSSFRIVFTESVNVAASTYEVLASGSAETRSNTTDDNAVVYDAGSTGSYSVTLPSLDDGDEVVVSANGRTINAVMPDGGQPYDAADAAALLRLDPNYLSSIWTVTGSGTTLTITYAGGAVVVSASVTTDVATPGSQVAVTTGAATQNGVAAVFEDQNIQYLSSPANGEVVTLTANGVTLSYVSGGSSLTQDIVDGLTSSPNYSGAGFTLSRTDADTILINHTTAGDKADAVFTISPVGTSWASQGTVTQTVDGGSYAGSLTTSAYNFGTLVADSNTLRIDTSELTGNVTLTVRAFLDHNGNGLVDFGEKASDVETVVLYGPGNYTATTTMFETDRSSSAIKARTVFSNSINASMVSGETSISFFKDGLAAPGYSAGSKTVDLVKNAVQQVGTFDQSAGTYHAKSYYAGATTYQVGAQSVSLDLRNGTNSVVTGVDPSVAATADARLTSGALALRSGTKSVTVSGQVTASSPTRDLEAAGIEVKAVVDGVELDAASVVSVTGATGTIDTDVEDTITAYAFTNAAGEVSFTLNNTVGEADDQVTVKLYFKNSGGIWIAASTPTITATWADAVANTFEVTPSSGVVSGSTISASFSVLDQWRQGISSNTAGALSVEAVAVVAGIEKPLTFRSQVNTSNGVASFSLPNFAAVGTSEILRATLIEGRSSISSSDARTALRPIDVTVYNTLATSDITVASSFANTVAYVDFVTGDLDVTADNAAAAAAGLTSGTSLTGAANAVAITGTVLNVNNQGQPGAAVTISAAGTLLFDPATKVLATDSITVSANALGYFEVHAVSHMVNTAGQTITITSGGVSETTSLKTYLPATITGGELVFSWTVPAVIVKDTTYSVVLKLADVWGNPVQTVDNTIATVLTPAVLAAGDGSLLVNGVTSGVARNFNSAGEATVFVRSVADVAGPGALRASLRALKYVTGEVVAGATQYGTSSSLGAEAVNLTATSWNETLWSSALEVTVDVLAKAPAAEQKVNAGSFKGYVAVYARGYEGQRLSAKIGNDWVIVDPIVNNQEDGTLFRVTDFTGAGVDIAVRIYIDRVLVDTINLTTK